MIWIPRQIWFWPVVEPAYNAQNAQFGFELLFLRYSINIWMCWLLWEAARWIWIRPWLEEWNLRRQKTHPKIEDGNRIINGYGSDIANHPWTIQTERQTNVTFQIFHAWFSNFQKS